MLQVKKNKLRISAKEFKCLKYLSRGAKHLYNVSLYNVRQQHFQEKPFLGYVKNYNKTKNHRDYERLPSDVAQYVMKMVDQNYRSFFALAKLKAAGKYDEPISPPYYMEKKGYFTLGFPIRKGRAKTNFRINLTSKLQDKFGIKNIQIPRPECLTNEKLKGVRIVPKCNAKYFEIEWIYEVETEPIETNKERAISIDPGVSNFATIVDSISGLPIILDGKKIKSINRFYNKENTRKKPGSRSQLVMFQKRRRILDDALNQYVNFIIQYCIENKVSKVVVGQGHLAQNESDLGAINNQNFVNIPFGKFNMKLEGKCEFYGIEYIKQEESYTSKCDHLAGEEMVHHDKYMGRRKHRGLFKSSTGTLLNADVNGALGILLKSKHEVDLDRLVSRGCLTQPRRVTLDEIQRNSSIRLVKWLCQSSLGS
jgi:IS605 OrfB family transposase